MRQKIVAGNWKMNKTYVEGIRLFSEIESFLSTKPAIGIKVIIAPSFIFIPEFAKSARQVSIAAQNCCNEVSGAYTGEVSATMLKSAGAEAVIIGHSERRNYYQETNSMLAKKTDLALQNNLNSIFCIGETLKERTEGRHGDSVKQQLSEGLFHLSKEAFSKIILAYEPVWAIGTGVTATAAQAQEMHAYIRKVVNEKYGETISGDCSILYGGSCNAQNSKELFTCPDVDGGLIGGASLKAEEFIQIIHSFNSD